MNSPKQLGEVLFERLSLPVLRKTGGTKSASTAVEVLEELAESHELPRLILDWRSLQKLKGTYIDALPALVNPETGRVHTSFNQAVAATGRLSSSDPNLQNIPIRTELGREIRSAFVAAPGHVLISADYSQIELRVLAHLAREETLIEAFKARRGHPRPHRGQGVRHDQRPRQARAAQTGEDRELRAALRQDGVHLGARHRRHEGGRAVLHRRLLRRLPARAPVHRRHARERSRHRRREDDVRPPAPGARPQQPQRPGAGGRGTRHHQHAHPGHRRRHPEARHDRRAPRPAAPRAVPRA